MASRSAIIITLRAPRTSFTALDSAMNRSRRSRSPRVLIGIAALRTKRERKSSRDFLQPRDPPTPERNQEFRITSTTAGGGLVDRCDEYRHFAEACIEMARDQEDPHERVILLQMAYIWSRLAEQAAAFANDETG